MLAQVEGQRVLSGNRKLLEREGITVNGLEASLNRLTIEGKTALEGRAVGVVAVADPIRVTARPAVEKLEALGVEALGVEVVLLSGDSRRTASAVGQQLGIQQIYGEVLPEDKAKVVAELQARGRKVAMVGDGVNDAPALAQAEVGIAIGAGTDVAVETAGVVLVKSNPSDVAGSIRLARAVRGKIKQNLFWAAFYNLLAIPVAAGVLYPSLGLLLRPE